MNKFEVLSLTPEERAELEMLKNSEAVKLAKKVLAERYKERQELYKLRTYQKQGEALMKELSVVRGAMREQQE